MSVAQKHKGAVAELSAILWLLANGYEVFRNVSQHGPADVIAIKDGKTLVLDIKTKMANTIPLAKPEQTTMGVLFLLVGESGSCEIVEPGTAPSDIQCEVCEKTVKGKRGRARRFCSKLCRNRAQYRRNQLLLSSTVR